MKIRICEQWRDMRADINPKVMHRLFEGAIAGVGREVRTEETDFYGFPSLVSASMQIKQFIGLMPKLVLPILVKPMGFRKQALLSDILNYFLVGEPPLPTAKSAKRKGKL